MARHRFPGVDHYSPTFISRSGCRTHKNRSITKAAPDGPANCKFASAMALYFEIREFTRLCVRDRCESRRPKARQAAIVVGKNHAVSDPTHGACGGHNEDNRLAHAASQLRDIAAWKWRRDQGRAGTAKTFLLSNHLGHLCAGFDHPKRTAQNRVVADFMPELWHDGT